MFMPKYQALHGLPPTKGQPLHIRVGWGLDAVNTGHGNRGPHGKLRKSNSSQAVKTMTFSQHITLLLLHSLQGRSSQPLCFRQASWGLAANLNSKPSPGDNFIAPRSLGWQGLSQQQH